MLYEAYRLHLLDINAGIFTNKAIPQFNEKVADWMDRLGTREVETQDEGTSRWAHVWVRVA